MRWLLWFPDVLCLASLCKFYLALFSVCLVWLTRPVTYSLERINSIGDWDCLWIRAGHFFRVQAYGWWSWLELYECTAHVSFNPQMDKGVDHSDPPPPPKKRSFRPKIQSVTAFEMKVALPVVQLRMHGFDVSWIASWLLNTCTEDYTYSSLDKAWVCWQSFVLLSYFPLYPSIFSYLSM